MSVIPKTVLAAIEFCENHVDPFTTNAVGIGTTTSAVSAWSAQVTATRNAYDAQKAAQLAAKDATVNLNVALEALMNSTSSIIKQVRAKAELSGDGIYALASLPVPAPPSPKPAPGKPSQLVIFLDETGTLNLKWKCVNPEGTSGTIYQIWRRIGAEGDFVYLGGTGIKSFVDNSLPAGSTAVTYQLQAVRSTSVGPWAQFNVNFGVGGGGAVMASVVEGTPAKIAA